jgi:hypothetical protein
MDPFAPPLFLVQYVDFAIEGGAINTARAARNTTWAE